MSENGEVVLRPGDYILDHRRKSASLTQEGMTHAFKFLGASLVSLSSRALSPKPWIEESDRLTVSHARTAPAKVILCLIAAQHVRHVRHVKPMEAGLKLGRL